MRIPEAIEGPTLQAAMAEAKADQGTSAERSNAVIADLWLSPGFLEAHRGDVGAKEEVPLRKLDDREMELIVGGWWSLIPDYDPWEWPGGPPNDPGDQYPGGTGSPGGTSYLDELENQCETDNKVDFAAQYVADQIRSKPDWNEREYAAIIYMTADGEVRTSTIFRGQTVAEAIAAGQIAPETHLTIPPDLGEGIILAVIHSHPDIGYGPVEDLENLYPSDRPGSGDYYGFEQLAGHHPAFANNAAFAQYILGPDGLLREYNAKDGRITPYNDADPASRTNLAKDRPCN